MYLFSNIIGLFVFDEKFDVIDKILFVNFEDYQNKNEFIEKVKNKHKKRILNYTFCPVFFNAVIFAVCLEP